MGSVRMGCIGPLASCRNCDRSRHRDRIRYSDRRRHRDRSRSCALKALDPLAVAERDIRALRTARADRARSDDYMNASGPRPFSPPGPPPHRHRTAPHRGRGRPHASPADCVTRACVTHPSHGSVAPRRARQRAPTAQPTATAQPPPTAQHPPAASAQHRIHNHPTPSTGATPQETSHR